MRSNEAKSLTQSLKPDSQIDHLVVQLRGYVPGKSYKKPREKSKWNRETCLIFDCETTTDPSQRLRFGAYQVRHKGCLIERGLFYADDLSETDRIVLKHTFNELEPTDDGERLQLLSVGQFIDSILFAWTYEVGGLLVGFNLPFDISRIYRSFSYAKRDMKGGFSFDFGPYRPRIRVKHLSQRASFFSFSGADRRDRSPDRGYFCDVKTLAATMTSASHSLASLAKLLGTTQKSNVDGFDGPLTSELVHYGINDVQVTWECFDRLANRYWDYGLKSEVHELYSEASLGKAFLDKMEIKPWREVQPDFPPDLIGIMMSSYFGGRAEVHIRRDIVPVIHCDFRSMYPTVCTLMGLWNFVIAEGIEWIDDTENTKQIVNDWGLIDLQNPKNWSLLTCLVQIKPDKTLVPIRARYGGEVSANIGLNYLSADEPMWFTLADILASKILSGKTPEITKAIRFKPKTPQNDLKPVNLADVSIHPLHNDFYKHLIDERGKVQSQEKQASDEDKATLKSQSQTLKILANSTSYGIFIELNVTSKDKKEKATLYDHSGKGRPIFTKKREEAGRYFHPLIATLITGAARLMLALAERSALDQGLNWAFCDTDSLAIANIQNLPKAEFIERVEKVRQFFEPLNPYEKPGSILQLEKVNFPKGQDGDMAFLEPIHCLAISAKRYVLFNRNSNGSLVIRKASAHGLGHLIAPYRDPDRAKRIGEIGVELWQEDLWRKIIEAYDRGKPDTV